MMSTMEHGLLRELLEDFGIEPKSEAADICEQFLRAGVELGRIAERVAREYAGHPQALSTDQLVEMQIKGTWPADVVREGKRLLAQERKEAPE